MIKALRAHGLVALILSLVVLSGLHTWLRHELMDSRFRFLTRPASGEIALVAIDARSIEAVGKWPWSRQLHGQLVDTLTEAGAAEIAFDVDFSAPSTDEADAAFRAALERSGGSVILAAFRQRAGEGVHAQAIHINRPIPAFADHSWPGLVNVTPDRDGVIRRYGFGTFIGGEFIPSIGALLAGNHDPRGGFFRIDFGIRAQSVPTFSYIDVIRLDPATLTALKGKKIIVSGTAAELGDRFVVPNGQILPGSLVQALAAESIAQGRVLNGSSPAISIGSVAVVLMLMGFVWRRLRTSRRALLLVGLGAAAEAAAVATQWFRPIELDTSLLWVAIIAYLGAMALDEIDFRGMLRLMAERRFELVATSLADGLVCVDQQGRIQLWNPAASRMFGYDRQSAFALPFEALLAADPRTGQIEFRLDRIPLADLQKPGGLVIETIGLRSNGERFDLECSLSSWETASGRQFGVVLRDISERLREQRHIRYLAEHDVVTGLANRNSLIARLETLMAAKDTDIVLVVAGIEHFQRISDVRGHSFSDALLVGATERLQALAPEALMIARVDSDEFALLVDGGPSVAAMLGQRLIGNFNAAPVAFGERSYRIAFSVAYATRAGATQAEEWFGNAHLALAAAKERAEQVTCAYVPAMRSTIEQRVALESELRTAFALGEFELFYQPQLDLHSRRIVGAEALIRWRHSLRGYVPPAEFMPVINNTALSDSVADWVLETACRQAREWQKMNRRIRVGINLSQSQFAGGKLVENMARILRQTGVSPELVELEVTEDIVLDHAQQVERTLADLRALGVRIAFDDFGTGYGSLTHLKKFPLDVIKIDQTFVRTLRPATQDAAIVSATITLGRALGLCVIAEGIETEETAAMLTLMGCIEGQGYHFSRPVPASTLTDLLREDVSTSPRMVA